METPVSRLVKRAAKSQFEPDVTYFSLDDAYTKISGVFDLAKCLMFSVPNRKP